MRSSMLVLSAILFAGTAFAQQGPQERVRGARRPALQALKNYLSLTDAQIANLTAVETALRDALKPLHEDLAAKRQALRAEKQKTAPDPNVIAQLNKDIDSLLSQIQSQRAGYQKQALSFLSPDQIALLDKLKEALQLMPIARVAAALDLITPPEGIGIDVPGAGMRGRMGPMMRRQRTN